LRDRIDCLAGRSAKHTKLQRASEFSQGERHVLSRRATAELGIKTIINLRGEDEVSLDEKKQAEAAGLHYFSVPMPGLSGPSDEVVARVMSIIDNPENQPVFIHCKRGSDRTGTIAAIYRISHDGWTADRALTEAKGYGLSWMEFGMKNYIADYYQKKQVRSRVEAASAATTH